MGLRRWSIRSRIFLLVAIPILSLIGVYAFAGAITASSALNLSHSRSVYNTISLPAGLLEAALDRERVYSVVYLADPAPLNLAALQAQQHKTDQSIAAFKAANASAAVNESTGTRQAFATVTAELARLPALRSQIANRAIGRPQVISAYGNMINQDGILEDQIILGEADVRLAATTLAINRTGNVVSLLLQEEALLLGDSLARSFSAADRQQFAELVGARRAMYAEMLSEFDPTVRAVYAKYLSPRVMGPLEAIENSVIADSHPGRVPPVSPITWSAAVQAASLGYAAASEHAAVVVTARAQPEANSIFLRLFLVGGLGLLAIILSIIMSAWIGRGLVGQLGELRRSFLELANKRLPSVMERLRSGQDVDVAAEAPQLEAAGDEIGQLTQAFNAVQRTAVEAAVDEAALRRGVSDVFRNLARRNQSLLHRQLALLDGMERRASEPEELEDLFRIDHLTTRMRRHAEGLIILSGEPPARGWRHPVPFMDVLRAAVAEVEDYTRVRVTVGSRAALIGPAVADVIHMIAELAENATLYSPPTTPVRVHGDVVGRGFAVEIEDRGLGINEEKLAEINNNFAHPPEFDLSGSEQLGLFVAGQLAKRHDIRITLQGSPFGGTTAIVLIPKALVVDEGAYDTGLPPAATAGERQIRLPSGPAKLSNGSFAEPAALPRRSALMPAAEPLAGAAAGLPPGTPADPSATAVPAAELPAAELPAAGLPAAPPSAAAPPPASEPPADTPPASEPPADTPPASEPPADTPPASEPPADLPTAGEPPADLPAAGGPHGHDTRPFAVQNPPTAPVAPAGTAGPADTTAPAGTADPAAEPAGASDPATPPPAAPAAQEESVFTPRRSHQVPATTGNVFSFGGDEPPPDPGGSGTADPRVDTAELAKLGLPVRVRQASLAPQLRDRGPGTDAAERVASAPSPEAARNIMTALQRGWERGRYISGSVTPPSGEPPDAEPNGNGGDEPHDQ